MNDFYLVWWTKDGGSPESQLMGICTEEREAAEFVDFLNEATYPETRVGEIYYSLETVGKDGQCM